MDIIICGAGEVGRHAAEVLSLDGHAVTVIDIDETKLAAIQELHDVRTLAGNSTDAEVLAEAGCRGADLCIAATASDESNLLTGTIAKAVGAKRCIARVHHAAYFEGRGLSYREHLGIDHLVCPEYSTAVAIAQGLQSPGALAIDQFARGKIDMRLIKVTEGSAAPGKTLTSLRLPSSARVALLKRQSGALIPDRDTKIEVGDQITLIAESEDIEKARGFFTNEARQRESVVILGGTPQAVWLCRELRGRAFSIRLLEGDRERAEELAEKLDWVTVLHTDLTDPSRWEEERVEKADTFVAVTMDDETNILSAARVKSLGGGRAVVVVQRATYLRLLTHVGIDMAFSPRHVAVDQIINVFQTGPIRRLALLASDVAVLYSVRAPAEEAGILGRQLRDVQFPQKLIIAAIQRGEEVFVPGGTASIQPGDEVILVGPPGIEKTLREMFGC